LKRTIKKHRSDNLPFKPRARMLLLLGDQLIRDPGIAVFELVKNAYDADSPDAKVTMSRIIDKDRGKIVIEDSGTGMDYETVTNDWLEPGTDYRALQREAGERTQKYGRLPMGEKGVGRFAAHKLGNHIRLITRKKDFPEINVEFNWKDFKKHRYLSEAPVKIQEQSPEVFTGRRTGTRIEITRLRNIWTRGMVRDLSRAVTSICSPFDKRGEFKAELILTENKDWLKGLLTVDSVLEYALFRAECDILGRSLTYEYEFTPLAAMDKVKARQDKKTMDLKLDPPVDFELMERSIGPVHLDLYIFDRDPKILALGVTDKEGLKEFLNEAGGIRVYRDGIRVYDYGEPGNDWLDLGGRRVNIPTKRISNNLVIGAVSLQIERSPGLIEKTNREGFVNNETFRAFKDAVEFAVTQVVWERNADKKRIRNEYSSKKLKEPVLADLTELRDIVDKKKLTKDLGAYLDRIEADFLVIRDRFLTSASAGLSLSVVIHEVEKGVEVLVKAVKEEKASPRIKRLAKHLADLVEGFAYLIRKSGTGREKAVSMISRAMFNTELRLDAHKIKVTVDNRQGDFEAKCSRRLIISTLMNLIDNSIWWLANKWGKLENRKRIYIGISKEFKGGPAIIVADNGPGFMDPPEYLIEPFLSRKPDGMGLGLHLADQVMKVQGGKLVFPELGDISLPKGFNGATVALVFGGTNR
jgi:anti-sigma regulatory factor (Ser/Thr protein kinase)